MKKILVLLLAAATLTACHESLADKAEREAREYTRKNCPTPVNNFQRTDSLVFDRKSETYYYYCSFTGVLDDATVVNKVSHQLDDGILRGLREAPSLKAYKEAGFSFAYVCRSEKDPSKVLYKRVFTAKDYK